MGQDVTIIYNVFHEAPLGVAIALYFYLTGLSAGSFILSTLAYGFGIKRYNPLGKVGVILSLVLLLLAPMLLIIDLERPLRFWHLFPYLNLASPVTWGSFLLTIYPLNSLLQCGLQERDADDARSLSHLGQDHREGPISQRQSLFSPFAVQ